MQPQTVEGQQALAWPPVPGQGGPVAQAPRR